MRAIRVEWSPEGAVSDDEAMSYANMALADVVAWHLANGWTAKQFQDEVDNAIANYEPEDD